MDSALHRLGPCVRAKWAGAARIASLFVTVMIFAGCEPEPDRTQPPPEAERVVLTPVAFDELPGWRTDQHAEAVQALLRSCGPMLKADADRPLGPAPFRGTMRDFGPACEAAATLPAGDNGAARTFFEASFKPFRVADNDRPDGLFTGYFEIEVKGAIEPDATYNVPVYRKPDDLVTINLGDFDPSLAGRSEVGRVEGNRLKPYFPREDIQAGALDGRGFELVWLDDPLDAFMLHVQGSGRVILSDGRTARIGYDGNNGYRYESIGRELIARGELDSGNASWPDIRAWMKRNPAKAKDLLAVNRRYIFFREIIGEGPIGAQGVPLTPGRSLAVDTRFIPLGLPLWLDTTWPEDEGRPLQRVMIAQDTGSAITGPVRGDFFWGTGDAALAFAGRMKQRGRYYILLPTPLAERMTGS